MNPLHDYIASQLAEKVKSKKLVVWYDMRSEFAPFIAELRGSARMNNELVSVSVVGTVARLAEYAGSMFELRAVVEPFVSGDTPESVVIYVPGCEHDDKGSVLMEIEKAGTTWLPQLKQLARNVLLQKYTIGVIDDMLPFDRKVSYEDLVRAASETLSTEPPSILKGVYHDISGNDAMLATWIANDERDDVLAAKDANRELCKLIRSRLELEIDEATELSKLRSIMARYLLANEFRSDFAGDPPASLGGVAKPKTKAGDNAVRDLSRRLRLSYPNEYIAIADRVESELHLATATIPAGQLGSIDTFRFEERALLKYCGDLIANQKYADALKIINEREQSFWVDRELLRKTHWDACRFMANLGVLAVQVHAAVRNASMDAAAWINAYVNDWYRLDQAQRHLESRVRLLEDDPDERALAIVRREYEDVCHAMAIGFTKAMDKAHWTVPTVLHQTHIFSDVVSAQPKPVAYFFVDAMRFEMGAELVSMLPKTSEVSLRPAVVALPSITPIGMAALLPGASSSFSITDHKGAFGARIDDTFLGELTSRKKHAAARLPKSVDLTLDEVLALTKAKLGKKIEGAQVLIVRSQDIDLVGESGLYQARMVMDSVIGNLAQAIGKLAKLGVERVVVCADHGHLFASDRDESMRIDAPGGETVDLHRRCWIGRGGATPAGCIRVAAAAMGYASDLDLVFPTGCGVFKAGGDLAFHHGGPSLQEMIVPVLTVLTKSQTAVRAPGVPISVIDAPGSVTNRIFSIKLQIGGANLALFSEAKVVRPLLITGDKQVGAVCTVIDGVFDAATGCVTLPPNIPLTVAFLLNDDKINALRIVIQDPATDAELYRSASDIPVRLGV
jgi:hypothetical protein